MASFKDHFSATAGAYASYRPSYPPALFAWLASQVPRHELAWDCATGNGQAALPLARHFRRVLATDASAAQLQSAVPASGVLYCQATAESPPLLGGSVDLITVAQALHWFDQPRFFTAARRVLAPGGVIAIWTYGRLMLTEPILDQGFQTFYDQIVGPYWPPERVQVEAGYRDLTWPFADLAVPPLAMTASWSLAQLLGYCGTWSAVQRYRAALGQDPLPWLAKALSPAWGEPTAPRLISWPLSVRVGRPPLAG